ncbi:hypothetical protein STCU_04198 [Strigomonas culicis]|uniref:JmjC domain-containing protein n=1 Tax=Strigomonas culicis TaxID=28005 RepID=S9W2X7_9TRYP|nr:hypothetical protein STCU_04198 [Strigomonas culicis]|eukprot:EPY30175.1 hypothetical protein STCU_04198 [Strigomonas culicis]
MPLSELLRAWAAASGEGAGSAAPGSLLYLRDWHLQRALETAPATAPRQPLYRVPSYLGGDWMDAFCRTESPEAPADGAGGTPPPLVRFGDEKSDYRFAYVGMPGTWTRLHYDVFGTYSWSFNVCGEKLWYFPTAASNAHILAHHTHGRPLPPDIRVMSGVEYFTVAQRPGDLVFVPSQYLHQVHNVTGETFPLSGGLEVELTVSLNHNWCNAYCMERMVSVFLQDVAALQRYLSREDVCAACGSSEPGQIRAFVDHLLRSGTNWNFASMLSFLSFCERTVRSDSPADAEVQRTTSLLQDLLQHVSLAQRTLFAS